MNAEQALQVIDQVCAQHVGPRRDHDLAREALSVLSQALSQRVTATTSPESTEADEPQRRE